MSTAEAPADRAGRSRDRFDRPIFIVSSPRSGSTLLFDTLSQAPGLFTTGAESHGRIERISGLSPADHGWDSNRLTAADATEVAVEMLAASFIAGLKDRDGNPPAGRVRMLEKTPKNALRIPFFEAAWPDAHFIYLYRDPRETLASMIEAWVSGRFRTYVGLPGWIGPAWSMLLVPGWRALSGRPIPEIAAHQWAITTSQMLDDFEALPSGKVRSVEYGGFVAEPRGTMERMAASLDLSWDRALEDGLPLSKTTVSRPGAEKWRRFESQIEAVMPIVAEADARAQAFLDAG